MSAALFREEMFRGRPHSILMQLLRESTGLPVTEALSSFSHRLIAKKQSTDPDSAAVFNLTTGFINESDVDKIVEGRIPESATNVAAVPEGQTTPLYLQWQVTDSSSQHWIVAAGKLTVRASLPYTP